MVQQLDFDRFCEKRLVWPHSWRGWPCWGGVPGGRWGGVPSLMCCHLLTGLLDISLQAYAHTHYIFLVARAIMIAASLPVPVSTRHSALFISAQHASRRVAGPHPTTITNDLAVHRCPGFFNIFFLPLASNSPRNRARVDSSAAFTSIYISQNFLDYTTAQNETLFRTAL